MNSCCNTPNLTPFGPGHICQSCRAITLPAPGPGQLYIEQQRDGRFAVGLALAAGLEIDQALALAAQAREKGGRSQ